jgi:hypothetical protein
MTTTTDDTTTSTPVRRRKRQPDGNADRGRSFKCPDTVWFRALAAARGNGRTLGSVIVEYLDDYARKNGHP